MIFAMRMPFNLKYRVPIPIGAVAPRDAIKLGWMRKRKTRRGSCRACGADGYTLCPRSLSPIASLTLIARTYGFGAAAGLAKTLHISDSRSAFLGSLFFLGYFIFQIPGATYARRKSASGLVFFALLSWGILRGFDWRDQAILASGA